jgi:proteic killer suppression protein
MINSFGNKIARDVFDGTNSRHSRRLPTELHPKAQLKMDQINAAPTLDFLRVPPGNRLEKLSGDMEGLWSIRINDQWRIVFRWEDNNALDVKIVDYH